MKAYLDNEWKKYFLVVAVRHHWMSVISTFLDHYSYLSQEVCYLLFLLLVEFYCLHSFTHPFEKKQAEWVTWFTLPYISSPHNHSLLSHYLSPSWEQEFLSTLHNFLHTAITHGFFFSFSFSLSLWLSCSLALLFPL